jgi:HemY protein
MLWSLIKIIFFVALVAAMTWGAGYLLESDGGIRVAVASVEFNLSPLKAVMALLVLVLVIWLLLKLASLMVAVLKFISGDETAISRYFDRNRERRGYEALSEALLALASGEGRMAMTKAARANKFLDRPGLTNLVTAQAAEMVGDTARAEKVYKALLQDEKTRFVGVRGLMKQQLSVGNTETAMRLAEKAFALKPRHVETQDALLQLQAGSGDWAGARATLGAKLKHGALPRDVHKRRDAVLALSLAQTVQGNGNENQARDVAIEANLKSPHLVPAAVMAARALVARSKGRAAAKLLKKAWAEAPHPDLAAAFAEIHANEDAATRLKRFAELTKPNPDHAQSRMLLSELQIAAEDFPAARRALGDLVEKDPTARALTLMAAIERGEGADEAVVRGWLTKALSASRGPQWVCDNCHTVQGEWAPVCANCAGFDTLSWTAPRVREVAMPASTEMLPLIVAPVNSAPAELVEEVKLPHAPDYADPEEEATPRRGQVLEQVVK